MFGVAKNAAFNAEKVVGTCMMHGVNMIRMPVGRSCTVEPNTEFQNLKRYTDSTTAIRLGAIQMLRDTKISAILDPPPHSPFEKCLIPEF